MNAEQLISQAVPMLESAADARLVPRAQRRLARGLANALRGPDGRQIAELIAPHVPNEAEGPDGPEGSPSWGGTV